MNGPIIAILKHRADQISKSRPDGELWLFDSGKLAGYLEAIELLEKQDRLDVPFTGDPMVDSTGGRI